MNKQAIPTVIPAPPGMVAVYAEVNPTRGIVELYETPILVLHAFYMDVESFDPTECFVLEPQAFSPDGDFNCPSTWENFVCYRTPGHAKQVTADNLVVDAEQLKAVKQRVVDQYNRQWEVKPAKADA